MTSEPGELPPTRRNPDGDPPSGPEVGERLPDFTLTDQHGRAVRPGAAREGRRALVVFHRSVRW